MSRLVNSIEVSRSGAGRAAPAQDRAVQALEQASAELGGSTLGPTSLYKYMIEKGLEIPKDAGLPGTNLHGAWQAGRIMRAPSGVYTPLDGTGRREWDRPLLRRRMVFPIPGKPNQRIARVGAFAGFLG
jgi:hypothetical protein